MKFFGWTVRKGADPLSDSIVDRVVGFLVMAYNDKVNKMLAPRSVDVRVSRDEYERFVHNGHLPERILHRISSCRTYLIRNMHCLLHDSEDFTRVIGVPVVRCDASLVDRIRKKTDGWTKTGDGIPYQALHDYVPVHLDAEKEGRWAEEVYRVRNLVWNFKYSHDTVTPVGHAYAMSRVADSIADIINRDFSGMTDKLAFFCLPASSRSRSYLRYMEFSRYLCKKTGLHDTFGYIKFKQDRTPSHLGGERGYNYQVHARDFEGRAVIVFDDILTTGTSVAQARIMLESAGAAVVAAFFIAKTIKDKI